MRHIETQVQAAIVRWLRFNGFLCTSTGAGLIKSVKTQITMKTCGYLPGTVDIIVWAKNCTLNIECKRPKEMKYSQKTGKMVVANAGGRQSDTQKEFEEQIGKIPGHHYIIAQDVLDVKKYIEENGILPA